MGEHQCKPTRLGGRAHDAKRGTVVVCSCGKAWGPTKSHHGPGGYICGCGWAYLENVTVSTPDIGRGGDQ